MQTFGRRLTLRDPEDLRKRSDASGAQHGIGHCGSRHSREQREIAPGCSTRRPLDSLEPPKSKREHGTLECRDLGATTSKSGKENSGPPSRHPGSTSGATPYPHSPDRHRHAAPLRISCSRHGAPRRKPTGPAPFTRAVEFHPDDKWMPANEPSACLSHQPKLSVAKLPRRVKHILPTRRALS